MSLIDMLKDKKVTFVKYFDGDLWYTTECGYEFPVPISEAGSTEFHAEDKALLFMRYVRKQQAREVA